MTVFTAVFLACTFQGLEAQCSVEKGRSYPTYQACENDTLKRAMTLNESPGPHKVALMPGKICMQTTEKGA